MSILSLYDDYSVRYETEGHKHCTRGWANTHCPFCIGKPDSLFLGVHLESWQFHCWQCGPKTAVEAISALCGVSEAKAKSLIRQYKGKTAIRRNREEANTKISIRPFKYPSTTGALDRRHRRYLIKRGFDPDKLEADWGLLGTGPVAVLDHIDYKHRIVAPIRWNGKTVSFQARDITGKTPIKYRACPKEREIVHHKEVLYGSPEAWDRVGICVEGVTDVWRLGVKSFATFGIGFTTRQVLEMAKLFRRVVVVFDNEPAAQSKARLLTAKLREAGVSAAIERVETGDPADLSDDDAKHLVNQITKEYVL